MSDFKIYYVHGAHSSRRSFSWIKDNLPVHECEFFEYDCHDPIDDIISSLVDKLNNETKKIRIIAHSLGGVISVIAADKCNNVEKIVTMSSPFGGSKFATLMSFFNPSQFFNNIKTTNPYIFNINNGNIPADVLSIVTTGSGDGNPVMHEKNDGVVTVGSQRALQNTTYIEVNVNHFEVLLDKDVLSHIIKFIF